VGDDPDGSEGFFGEHVAAVYDERSANMFDPAVVGPAVDTLAELAGDGAALEFAIGTGRIALPLAERGVRVAGIDNSQAMVARLRDKAGAEQIDAVVGDMAATRVDGEFALVYLSSTRSSTWSPRTARWRAFRTPPPICAAAGAS
jgi:ubiquinone/menaquinone biosynthesis C-methylase UbiE